MVETQVPSVANQMSGTDLSTKPGTPTSPLENLRKTGQRSWRALADILMPPVCLSCHAPLTSHDGLCPECWTKIDFIRPPLCDRLGLPMPFATGPSMISAAATARPPRYDRARAVARYDDTMRKIIHDLKFRDTHDARRLFGRWLAETGRELLDEADLIVPVPLAKLKLLTRRFNQSAILAQETAKIARRPWQPGLLQRTRRTQSQVGLTHTERRRNVKGAFAVPANARKQIADKRIVLIDDVITTGATAEACTVALLSAGASSVDILALALVTDAAAVTT